MRTLSSNKPLIAITMGDPSGIGAEVIVKALASLRNSRIANFFVVGDRGCIDRARKSLGIKVDIQVADMANVPAAGFAYGKSKAIYGMASMQYIDMAVDMVKDGSADAIVTAPINKESISMAGYRGFQGHTEHLAARTGTNDFAMMFVGGDVKIALVTRHVALKDVPKAVTKEKVISTIRLTQTALREWFGIKRPVIGVAGLNPHAGEHGMFGTEEGKVIIPVLKKLSGSVKGLVGPVPPDVIFYQLLKKKYDAVISMYHDQALIPFKTFCFDTGVNLTLGLPFVRTSPDHGTAFDIAGKGKASSESMVEALKLAARLCG